MRTFWMIVGTAALAVAFLDLLYHSEKEAWRRWNDIPRRRREKDYPGDEEATPIKPKS